MSAIKNKARRKLERDTVPIVLRVSPVLAVWLQQVSDREGRSRNDLMDAWLSELRKVEELTTWGQGEDVDPEMCFSMVGSALASACAGLGVGGLLMKAGRKMYADEQRRLMLEVEESRRNRLRDRKQVRHD